jgi:tRNA A37 methylthiotransferase MiaB
MCSGEKLALALSAALFARHRRRALRNTHVIIAGCMTDTEKQMYDVLSNGNVFKIGEESLLAKKLKLEKYFPVSGLSDSAEARKACAKAPQWAAIRIAAEIVYYLADLIRLPVTGILRRFLAVTSTYSSKSRIIRVSSGCLGKCTYCTERKARGALRSRPINVIIDEIRKTRAKGTRHFSFVSDDLGVYGKDIGVSFVDLIRAALFAGEDLTFSLRSLNARRLIEHIKEFSSILIPGRITDIEVPVQSGNNRILGLMKREHTIEPFFDAVWKILSRDPSIAFKIHIITGFPGETEKEFDDTIAIASRIPVDNWNITCYSPCAESESSEFEGQVSKKTMNARNRRLKLAIAWSFVKRALRHRGY